MDVISHPFRLGPSGRVATVAQGSDDHTAEAVAVTALTRKGERELVPDFGVADPVFDEVDVGELNAVLATFGPDTTVTAIDVEPVDDTTVRVVLAFDSDDETTT